MEKKRLKKKMAPSLHGKEKTEEENGKNWAALQKFHALKSIVKFTITHRVGYVSKKA